MPVLGPAGPGTRTPPDSPSVNLDRCRADPRPPPPPRNLPRTRAGRCTRPADAPDRDRRDRTPATPMPADASAGPSVANGAPRTGRGPSTSSSAPSRRVPRGVWSAPTIRGSPTTIVARDAEPPRSCPSMSDSRCAISRWMSRGILSGKRPVADLDPALLRDDVVRRAAPDRADVEGGMGAVRERRGSPSPARSSAW